jgi:hypothetical protein
MYNNFVGKYVTSFIGTKKNDNILIRKKQHI